MLSILFSKRMLVMFLLGFSSGVPFLIIRDVIKAWLTDAHVDIGIVGLFSAVSLPYTYKFMWSPLMDRFSLPWGRRRGWMLATQIGLGALILVLGQLDPARDLYAMAVVCLTIAFFGASQDIVLDAFRREVLPDPELGLGTSVWSIAYRLANLATVGIAFALADTITYQNVHWILSGMMLVGVFTTLLVPEPPRAPGSPRTLREAVVDPFVEFFKRPEALWILSFILLYKLGDNMASAMNVPFVLQLGFEKTQYFKVVKLFGMIALFAGMFIGGLIMVRTRTTTSLIFFGILQMISTGGFCLLNFTGTSELALTLVVSFELMTTGMGQAAYAAFIAMQTNKRFSATQFALMTSLMALPGTIAGASTGYLVKGMGWIGFYIFCMVVAIPGLWLALRMHLKSPQETPHHPA